MEIIELFFVLDCHEYLSEKKTSQGSYYVIYSSRWIKRTNMRCVDGNSCNFIAKLLRILRSALLIELARIYELELLQNVAKLIAY